MALKKGADKEVFFEPLTVIKKAPERRLS